MNEPIQHAQKSTGVVTAKQMLTCIRAGGDSLYIHGQAAHDRASYSDSYVFTMSSVAKDRKSKVETTTKVDVPGYVSNGRPSVRITRNGGMREKYTEFDGVYRPLKGFWSLGGFKDDRLTDILELLPSDAEVAFHVALDYGTHEYLVRADVPMNFETYGGLHADMLFLRVRHTVRGKVKERSYLLDEQVIPHNTARFGAPGSAF